MPGGDYLTPGTGPYRAAGVALFLAGFGTFAVLYSIQPLMPRLSAEFGVSPTQSSLALSAATATLAASMLAVSAVSDRTARKRLMAASILTAAILTLAVAVMPSWPGLLALRAATGLVLSGVPAVAMAYLGEEVDRQGLPRTVGLYIGGTALGGLSGRLLTGLVVDLTDSWRLAVAVIGLLGLAGAAGFVKLLPPSRHFTPVAEGSLSLYGQRLRQHLADPLLRRLFLTGFLLMGSFVTLYNYTGYRLVGPPFGLRESWIGAIFLVYLAGMPSSAAFGTWAARWGHARVLAGGVAAMLAGVALTLSDHLAVIVAGTLLLTAAFFGSHAVASAWIAAHARTGRVQASGLYFFFYYLGSSLFGSGAGQLWSAYGWTGVAGLVMGLLALALAVIAAPRKIPQ
jgi:YNFM family putative membrane transporter